MSNLDQALNLHPGNVLFPQLIPENVKAIQDFNEEGKLAVTEGDLITVIEGR